MSKKFNELFKEIVKFYPEGYCLSKELYTKEEALAKFSKDLDREVNIVEIGEEAVRWQPTNQELLDEGLDKWSWILCYYEEKNAQKIWYLI